MKPADLGRTLRTARYLRREQIIARSSFVAERRLLAARPDLLRERVTRRLASIESQTRDAPPVWRWPPAPLDPAARADLDRGRTILDGQFTFLNQTERMPWPIDWRARPRSRRWRFDWWSSGYAVDLAALARSGDSRAFTVLEQLVQGFMAQCPPGAGDAWHPFVASSRVLAWTVARDLLQRALQDTPELAALWRSSLLSHGLYLEHHLEVDVGGNHLLKNLAALLALGCAFDGPAPRRWRDVAARGLERELAIQVLPDGGHYERSPMYHLLVLADLLQALLLAGRREMPIAVPLADAVRRMQRFALTLRHPDGDIPLFNDAVQGEAPPPSRLVGPATEPVGDWLPASGYTLLRARTDQASGTLIADCGPPGPDDLPAHVHADALSFELSVGQRRVLVDGGMLDYEPGPARTWLRGTAAHNTVQVDGQDQSEVWGVFRVGRRARVQAEQWQQRPGGATLVGVHDGYARLGVTHRRQFDAVHGAGWRILDTLSGTGSHQAASRLRLHPGLRWENNGDEWQAMTAEGDTLLRVRPIGPASATLESGLYAARFNRPETASVLCLRWSGPLPVVSGYWLLLPGGQPVVV